MPEIQQEFPDLQEPERPALSEPATTKSFASGDSVIKSGNMRTLQQCYDHSNVESTGSLDLGDLFGEVSFTDGRKARATLVADVDVEVCRFACDDVNALLEQESGSGMRFYRSLPGTVGAFEPQIFASYQCSRQVLLS